MNLWFKHKYQFLNSIHWIMTFTAAMNVSSAQILVPKYHFRASLVAQWLGICLPMQGTRVRALVWEDPTCRRATKPVSHNYWACASGACAPQRERPRQWEARAPRWRVAPARWKLEKVLVKKWRPNTVKEKKKKRQIIRVYQLNVSWGIISCYV